MGAAKGGVDIGQAVIIAGHVMHELPGMGHLGGGSDVLGKLTQFIIIGDDHAAAAGGDGFVAVETEYAQLTKSARVPALVIAAYGLG